MPHNRRQFLAKASAAVLLPAALANLGLPATLLALDPQVKDSVDAWSDEATRPDMEKILTDLPHAAPHIPRIKDACDKYAEIYPIPLILPAKVQAIESGYDPDAISESYAVGCAQFMHPTARDLGAVLPPAEEFDNQKNVLNLRRKYQSRMGDAVSAFSKGDDARAKTLRAESKKLQKEYEALHKVTKTAFRKRMMDMSEADRRAYDQRFDPIVTDDLLVKYLAQIARSIKRSLDVSDERDVLLLAGVAYNAGIGSVKRKPGIPVVAQNVEYANKIMLFQTLNL